MELNFALQMEWNWLLSHITVNVIKILAQSLHFIANTNGLEVPDFLFKFVQSFANQNEKKNR